MSTVEEIEAAVPKLAPKEPEELCESQLGGPKIKAELDEAHKDIAAVRHRLCQVSEKCFRWVE
jgi:hypothetical protein